MTIHSTTSVNSAKVRMKWEEDYTSESVGRAHYATGASGIRYGFRLVPDTGQIVKLAQDSFMGESLLSVRDDDLNMSFFVREDATEPTFDLSSHSGSRVWILMYVDYQIGSPTDTEYRVVDSAELGNAWTNSAIMLGSVEVPSSGGITKGDINHGITDLQGFDGTDGLSPWSLATDNPNFDKGMAGWDVDTTHDYFDFSTDTVNGFRSLHLGDTSGSGGNDTLEVKTKVSGLMNDATITRGDLVFIRLKAKSDTVANGATLDITSLPQSSPFSTGWQTVIDGDVSDYEDFGFVFEHPGVVGTWDLGIRANLPNSNSTANFYIDQLEVWVRKLNDDKSVGNNHYNFVSSESFRVGDVSDGHYRSVNQENLTLNVGNNSQFSSINSAFSYISDLSIEGEVDVLIHGQSSIDTSSLPVSIPDNVRIIGATPDAQLGHSGLSAGENLFSIESSSDGPLLEGFAINGTSSTASTDTSIFTVSGSSTSRGIRMREMNIGDINPVGHVLRIEATALGIDDMVIDSCDLTAQAEVIDVTTAPINGSKISNCLLSSDDNVIDVNSDRTLCIDNTEFFSSGGTGSETASLQGVMMSGIYSNAALDLVNSHVSNLSIQHGPNFTNSLTMAGSEVRGFYINNQSSSASDYVVDVNLSGTICSGTIDVNQTQAMRIGDGNVGTAHDVSISGISFICSGDETINNTTGVLFSDVDHCTMSGCSFNDFLDDNAFVWSGLATGVVVSGASILQATDGGSVTGEVANADGSAVTTDGTQGPFTVFTQNTPIDVTSVTVTWDTGSFSASYQTSNTNDLTGDVVATGLNVVEERGRISFQPDQATNNGDNIEIDYDYFSLGYNNGSEPDPQDGKVTGVYVDTV